MGEVTALLNRVATGDGAVRDQLYRLIYPELMRLARGHLSRSGTLSLDASAVLHDAYLRLTDKQNLSVANRRMFYAYASRVMHSVIVDYVRESRAQKRGGDCPAVTLNSDVHDPLFTEHSLTDVERGLQALASADERAYRVVEMRYFAGLTEEDVAEMLEVSLATVRRDWRKARAFLFDFLR
jgi:RNA polymerase sigma factor (TIGR02999 family)